MGWERKRGKLVDFNAFISGADDDAFSVTEGDLPWLRAVRYVITLDADTVLPRGAAARAHRHDRASAQSRRVRRRPRSRAAGYGILQPRVSVSLAERERVALCGDLLGAPRRRSVHDRRIGRLSGSVRRRNVHGKGHLRRRRLSTRDGRALSRQRAAQPRPHRGHVRARRPRDRRRGVRRLPDALSHGDATARTAGFAATGSCCRWLRARVPGPAGPTPNPLSALSRWKIADNMRRSLSARSRCCVWLVAGWTVPARRRESLGRPSRSAALGTPWIVPLLFAAVAAAAATGVARRTTPRSAATPLRAAQQLGLAVILLPDQALLATDAIVRSLVRVLARIDACSSGKPRRRSNDRPAYRQTVVWRRMWPAVVAGRDDRGAHRLDGGADSRARCERGRLRAWAALATDLACRARDRRSPSAPRSRGASSCSTTTSAHATLRYALRHWRYFDRFVTAETHWLVPDNFQETPSRWSRRERRRRTSACNARDDVGVRPGFSHARRDARPSRACVRLARSDGRACMGTSTTGTTCSDLRVLDPPYVSTVDSGISPVT